MSEAALIACDRVSFAYGTIEALIDLSFSVAEGEILGLLGPNGSGKSTVVRLLSRVLTPQSGRVRFAGRDLGTYSREELARQVAVVPLETAIELPFSVLEVVLMGRSPYPGGLGFERALDLTIPYRCMAQTRGFQVSAPDSLA